MNKSLVKLVGAGGMPWAVAKMSMSAVAIAVAALTAGCDASKATEEPRKQAAQLPKGFIQVKPESVKMLEIAAVADPQGVQMAWAPAHVAFVEDRVASVSVPVSARVVAVNAHVGDMVKAGDLLGFVATQLGGKGGGRPDMAQGGGTDVAALPAALASVQGWVAERV